MVSKIRVISDFCLPNNIVKSILLSEMFMEEDQLDPINIMDITINTEDNMLEISLS